ncbi:hypothetical protein GALL_386840 [mine drainage metagenome]|uniref:Uncharacterized protein n=1 Tax=mine drainage metagenome TaxID=410659 RepID=A0A1J5QUJ7_9ZZZZ
MGRVHVAHLEAGALARQAARSQGGDTAFVGDLGERIGLVHELRQLARTEKFLDRRRNRFGVDQIVRHQIVRLCLIQPLLDRPLDAHQAGAELVLGQFADRAHAPVAEMVDIVDLAPAIPELDQDADHVDDVFIRQRAAALQPFAIDPAVELHAADDREVVALLGIEKTMEQRLDGILGWRLARTHHAVDGDARRQLVTGLVDAQRR